MSRALRRKKKSPASHMRPFWFLIVLLLALAAIGGYYGATWPGFFPQRVTVNGERAVPAEQIASRAAIDPHRNLWLQNMGVVAAAIESIPYIDRVWIRRTLPANVHITVRERRPFALLECCGRSALVDRQLRILQYVQADAGLPVFAVRRSDMLVPGAFVKDSSAARMREDYDLLARSHVVAASLRYDAFGDLIATMHSGVRLLLGDDRDLAKKAPLVAPILSQVGAGGRRIAAVDLRAPKTPVVVFR